MPHQIGIDASCRGSKIVWRRNQIRLVEVRVVEFANGVDERRIATLGDVFEDLAYDPSRLVIPKKRPRIEPQCVNKSPGRLGSAGLIETDHVKKHARPYDASRCGRFSKRVLTLP
jgi:hypothetical protein